MGIVKLSAPRLSYRLKRAIFAWMWTKGYTVEISVLEYLVFLSWQIQWWWVWMIDTWGFTRCLQVQVQVCWDFCCSGKQKFQTKNQQQHVDSLGKKTHCHGRLSLFQHQQKKNGPLAVSVCSAPHNSRCPRCWSSPRWKPQMNLNSWCRNPCLGLGNSPRNASVFFWKQFRKSWNSLLYWFHGHLPGGPGGLVGPFRWKMVFSPFFLGGVGGWGGVGYLAMICLD